ncbi:hypothetical protein LCGC14_0290650 [marine sediment metagenome]|uniref:GIY-YIG domain-containing protein n=1 Tax=marine sediment metagenome TaxID=412755 RepID=A0A0F9WEF3_9ZZZZ
MVKEETKPYGYIYKATNIINGKVYIGKTKKAIEKRWNGHLKEARALKRLREAFPNEKISGSHFNNALIKYGPEAFILNQKDIADNKSELNEKEKYYIKEYDSMNPDKGYNMTEGGEGGEFRQEVIERMTRASQERAKDPEWREKITKINREITQRPGYSEKVSNSITKIWGDRVYQQKQQESRDKIKKKIEDKHQFLKDIQNMQLKDIAEKYNMDQKTVTKRIREILGDHGVMNHTNVKKYLKDKDLDDVVRDINERLSDQTEKFEGKTISDKRELLEDIQNMQKQLIIKFESYLEGRMLRIIQKQRNI